VVTLQSRSQSSPVAVSSDWKFAYTTRRVPRDRIAGILSGDDVRPRAGDREVAADADVIWLRDGRLATSAPAAPPALFAA